jgi:hypothetical protein
VVSEQRQALLHPLACVYVSADEPQHEEAEEARQNDPLDYQSFLRRQSVGYFSTVGRRPKLTSVYQKPSR